jgi:hypothetical protein
MLRRVALVRTDVSEELSASIFGVTRIGELGTLADNSEASVLTRATLRNIPEDAILRSHRRENLKPCTRGNGAPLPFQMGPVLNSPKLSLIASVQ